MKAQAWRSPSRSIQICISRQGGGLLRPPREMVNKEGRGRRIYHLAIDVANHENVQDKDGRRARRKRADRSFRTETYDIGFYARNNAPAVGVVCSRKTKVGTMCFKFSLRLAALSERRYFFQFREIVVGTWESVAYVATRAAWYFFYCPSFFFVLVGGKK